MLTSYNEDEGAGWYNRAHLYQQPPFPFPTFKWGHYTPFFSSLSLLFSGPSVWLLFRDFSSTLSCLGSLIPGFDVFFFLYLLPCLRSLVASWERVHGVYTFWDVTCLNISLFYFNAWLKICLGVEFPKMKILFIWILKAFFPYYCGEALVKTILCVHPIYFIFFLGVQDGLVPQPYLQLGQSHKIELWSMGCGWSWCAHFRLHCPPGSLFPFHGGPPGHTLKMVLS